MTKTHDYETVTRFAESLNETHVLVGESAGLSAVYSVEPSPTLRGYMRIHTEHGFLYARPTDDFQVLWFEELESE